MYSTFCVTRSTKVMQLFAMYIIIFINYMQSQLYGNSYVCIYACMCVFVCVCVFSILCKHIRGFLFHKVSGIVVSSNRIVVR